MRNFLFLIYILLISLHPNASYAALSLDGFETGNWSFSSATATGSALIDATVSHSGSKCLKINVVTASPTTPWDINGKRTAFGTVKLGKKYKLKFWCKSDAGSQIVKFGFNVSGTNNELNSNFSSLQSTTINARNWEQKEVTFVATRTAVVDLYFHGATNQGVIYIDDLLLEPQPMGINDPGFETQNWYLGGTLVNNSYSTAYGSFTYDNSVQRTGNWSLKINTTNANNPWDMMTQCGSVYLERNKEYKVSFWARGDGNGLNRTLTVGLANGLYFPTILDATTWQLYTFNFTCNGANAGIKDINFQVGGSNGIFWVDDVEIIEIVKEQPLAYGFETNNLLPVNSGFEFGTTGGFSNLAVNGASAVVENDNTNAYEAYKSLKVTVNSVSGAANEVQVFTNNLQVLSNHDYILSFWAKADNGQKIDVKITDSNNNTWLNGQKQFTLTNQWKRYFYESISNIVSTESDIAKLTFMIGNSTGAYWLDNIVLADMDTLNFNTNLPAFFNSTYSTQLKNGDFEFSILQNWVTSVDGGLSNIGSPYNNIDSLSNKISIDLAISTDTITHATSGFLYGFSSTLPATEFFETLTPKLVRYHAMMDYPNVNGWHWEWQLNASERGNTSLKCDPMINRLEKMGVRQQIIAGSEFTNRGYQNTVGWPGDPVNNGVDPNALFEQVLKEQVQYVLTKGIKNIEWDIWNEPDVNDFWPSNRFPSQFLATWKFAYQTIKKYDPNAKIVGPSYAAFEPWIAGKTEGQTMREFLDFTKLNNCMPDRLVWHELNGVDSHRKILKHVTDIRNYMQNNLQMVPLPIDIPEIIVPEHLYHPGVYVWHFAEIEKAKVEGACHAVWEEDPNMWHPDFPVGAINLSRGLWAGHLCHILTRADQTPAFSPRASWHTYKKYAEMKGERVAVTAKTEVPVNGIVALDATSKMVKGLFGNDSNSKYKANIVISNTLLTGESKSMKFVISRIPDSGNQYVSTLVSEQKEFLITNSQIVLSIEFEPYEAIFIEQVK